MHIHWVKFRRSIRGYLLNAIFRLFAKRRFLPAPGVVNKLRKMMRGLDARLAKLLAPDGRKEEAVSSIPATWTTRPDDPAESILLYLHGGAFFMRTPNNHLLFLERLRDACSLKSVIPFYRLAPEHPFPSALEDCIAAYQGLLDGGYSANNIILAGDSAGGNLALAVMQHAIREGLPLPACAVLLSPGLDLSPVRIAADSSFSKDPVFPGSALEIVTETYLQVDSITGSDPRVSPLLGDFRGLPPLLFIAGSTELFLQDSISACNKAVENGVDARAMIWRGMPHCFPLMQPRFLPESGMAMKDIAAFIKRHRPAP